MMEMMEPQTQLPQPIPSSKQTQATSTWVPLCTIWGLQGAGEVEWGWIALLHPAEILPCAAGADPGCAGESHGVPLLSLPAFLHTQISPTQVCWSILTFPFIFKRLEVILV